jgi:DNA-binding CsgD family transcriptional regulator
MKRPSVCQDSFLFTRHFLSEVFFSFTLHRKFNGMKGARKEFLPLPGAGNRDIKQFYEAEKDRQSIMECVELLQQFYPEKVIQVCRMNHPNALHVTSNCFDLWGVHSEQFKQFTTSNWISFIHPDDFDSFMKANQRMSDYIDHDDPAKTRFVFTYRMKDITGTYFYANDERLVIRTKNNNHAYFCIFSKSDQKLVGGSVAVDVFQINNNRKIKINSFLVQSEQQEFSMREIDIIKLIDRGLSNTEIASNLSLSVFTIKNHKQRLFKKMQAKNSIELLRYARTTNIL